MVGIDIKTMQAWIVTEGIAGTENQCLGIAEALGIPYEIKRITLRQPWKSLSPYVGFEQAGTFTPPLLAPWPDVVIAGGRKAIAAVRYIRKMSDKTFTVFVQDPRIRTTEFDLVIVPEHDPARGENVFVTTASPNKITDEKLAAARVQFSQFEKLKFPRIAVLIGGDSKSHKLTEPVMRKFVRDLKKLDAGLMITASRRTGEENRNLLLSSFGVIPAKAGIHSSVCSKSNSFEPALSMDSSLRWNDSSFYFWDGTGPNPYFGMLAWADYIIVTSDSVSMLSEAATSGKPVYMVELEGGSPRLNQFHENLVNKGISRVFDGNLENWAYEPLKDAQKAADEIKKRLKFKA